MCSNGAVKMDMSSPGEGLGSLNKHSWVVLLATIAPPQMADKTEEEIVAEQVRGTGVVLPFPARTANKRLRAVTRSVCAV